MDRQDAQGDAMNDPIDDDRLWVSALADGEATPQAQTRALAVLAHDPQAREAWQAYHLVGDVLRSQDLAGTTAPDVFLARFRQRLAEDAVAAPLPVAGAQPAPVADARRESAGAPREAANARSFRRRHVAAIAGLALATVVGGFAVQAWWTPAGSVHAKDPAGRMLRDARLDELLQAHRQLGGATALPAPAGFVHPASFERPVAAPAR